MIRQTKSLCGFALCLALLLGCSRENTHAHLEIIETIANMQNGVKQSSAPKSMEIAKALITQADSIGYTLITPMNLHTQLKDFRIIATLPRGIYNLGLIPNAMHLDPQTKLNGIVSSNALESSQDSKQFILEHFRHLLGHNKNAKILFYDEGNTSESLTLPLSPSQSTRSAIVLAKELGYTNIYYLLGGLKVWKALKLPMSTQIPSCCM